MTRDQFAGVIPLFQAGFGTFQAFQGASIIEQSSLLEASQLRQAGAAAMSTAYYNAQVIGLQRNRQLDALARNIPRFLGTQRSQAAGLGFSPASKSSLLAQRDALTNFERQIMDTRATAKINIDRTVYEGQLRQTAFENQARAAEYRGQIGAFQARSRALTGLSNSIGNFLGGF